MDQVGRCFICFQPVYDEIKPEKEAVLCVDCAEELKTNLYDLHYCISCNTIVDKMLKEPDEDEDYLSSPPKVVRSFCKHYQTNVRCCRQWTYFSYSNKPQIIWETLEKLFGTKLEFKEFPPEDDNYPPKKKPFY